MADPNNIKPFITPDWTQMDGRSKPFYQAASGTLPDRYSATVLSQYATTGGNERQNRMNETTGSGLNRILRHYSKMPSGSMSGVRAEDFYISPRPNAKMKVLVSFPVVDLNLLPDKKLTYSSNVSPEYEIKLNTFDIKTKIKVATKSLVKYGLEIEKFHGKIYGFNYDKESSKLLGFMPALIKLMEENNVIFSESESDLITLFATSTYDIIYGTLSRGTTPIVLSKGFDNFVDNPSVKHKRVIKILSQLDELDHTIKNNKNLSWSQFFDKFIYDPPKFDFSIPRPSSPTLKEDIEKELEKDNKNPIKTKEQLHLFAGFVNLPENNKSLADFSEKASIFIGDSIIGNLEQLGNTVEDVSAVFEDVLNATGLDGILKAALDCLDINTEWGLGTASQNLLDSVNQLFSQIERGLPHNVPTISLPDDIEIVNLLRDIGMTILKTLIGAVIGALIALIQELIKLMFQFCSECSIRTEDGFVKKYNKLNFGKGTGTTWGQFAGDVLGSGAVWEGAGHALAGGVIGAFGNSEWSGNLESFSQGVLKNSINNIDKLYDHEAQRIFDILKSEIAGDTSLPYSGMGPTGYFTGTEQAKNVLAFQFGSTPEELNKSGFTKEMTLSQVLEVVKRKSPWSAAVFQEASKQLSEYLDVVLTSWTPGEIGNAMLGCGIPPEANEVARNALPSFPALDLTLRGDDDAGTDDNLADVWATMGKMVGHEPVLKAITQLAEDIPDELKCLSDLDDSNLRRRLLAEKDPTLDPEEIADQVAKAKKRNRDKIQEISDLIGRGDILQGKMPPLYCSASVDGTIIPGILPVSHPTTVFAIKRALDTTYDSLKMTFNTDVSTWVPALSIKTVTSVEVERTTVIRGGVFGGGERIWNPDFRKMVREGLVTYGSLPYGSIVPGSRTPPEDRDDPFDPEDDGDPTEVKYNYWLAGFSDEWANPAGMGMWEEGQSEPTPEQEHDWERRNMILKPRFNEDGDRQGTLTTGGRTWENLPPISSTIGTGRFLYGFDWKDRPVKPMDYTRQFGYSPIPVYETKEGPPNFIPGARETYRNMCTDTNLFDITLGNPQNVYSFFVPNTMLKNAGIDFQRIKEGINTYSGELVDKIKVDGIWDKIRNSLDAINSSKFNIQYVVPSFNSPPNTSGEYEIPKDEYRMDFSIDTPDFPNSGADAFSTMRLAGVKDSVDLPDPVRRVIENQSLDIVRQPLFPFAPVQPQVGYFYDFANHVWETGGTLYRNGLKVRGDSYGLTYSMPRMYSSDDHESTIEGFGNVTFDTPDTPETLKTAFIQAQYRNDTYKNLFKDLFCSFTNQIAESPYLQLGPNEDGKPGMLSVNFTPAKLLGWDPTCQKTLLDVDIIKEQIVREHDLLKCIKRNWRTEKNMESNRNSPYQVASRAGCILLTVRVYVIEYVLRFAYAFHYFTPSSVDDIDQTSVFYVYNKINQEVAARGLGTAYYFEFQKQAIELYNRNKPKTERLGFDIDSSGTTYISFRKALEALVRYQIFSVSRRLSKDFVNLRGDVDGGDPHSIFIQEWLPTIEPPKEANELRFANDDGTNKKLRSFNETTGVRTVTMDEIAAVMPDGTLSDEAIERMPDPFRNQRQSHPVGELFRGYFAPNRHLEMFSGWSTSDVRQGSELLWPAGVYTGTPRAEKDSSGGVTWITRPVMIGPSRESSILDPSSRITGDKNIDSSLTSPEGRSKFFGFENTQNRYALGVSQTEKDAMTRVTQMMYASQFWTLPEPLKVPIKQASTQEFNEWYAAGNDFFRQMDLPLGAKDEGNRTQVINQAVIQWSHQKTTVYDQALKAAMEQSNDAASARVSAMQAQNIWVNTHPLEDAKEVAAGKFDQAHRKINNLNDLPFWAYDLETKYNMVAGSWSDYDHTISTAPSPTEEVASKTKFFGPGSLLRWMTTKKAILQKPGSSAGPTVAVADTDDLWKFTTQMFVSFGLSWAVGNKLPDDLPIAEVGGPYRLHVADPNHSGRNETILTRGKAAYGEKMTYNRAWMDPYSTSVKPWNPENVPDTEHESGTHLRFIGMPDLPVESLTKLGIEAGGVPNTPTDRTKNRAFFIDRPYDPGSQYSLPKGRPNHLLFYLLPQSHWLGWALGATGPTAAGGKRSKWYSNVERAIEINQQGYTQYISLLDLHPDAVRRALIWEQGMYMNLVKILNGTIETQAGTLKAPSAYYGIKGETHRKAPMDAEIQFYEDLIIKYDTWINEWTAVMDNLREGKEQRKCAQERVTEIINSGKLPRNEMQTPPMYDIKDGNPILEPYIRIIDYTTEEAAALKIIPNVDWAKARPELTKGVVNIDKWDEFMESRFGQSNNPQQKRQLSAEIIPKSPDEECGDDLPSRSDRYIVTETPAGELQLKDYFKEIHYGLRIMYLPKPGGFVDPEHIREIPPERLSYSNHEKAFWIKEKVFHAIHASGLPPQRERWLNPYPLIAVETPVDMLTSITKATTPQLDHTTAEVKAIIDTCSQTPGKPAEEVYTGYFRSTFKSIVGNQRFSSPRDILQKELIKTNEYQFLFKYCFPFERMLSLLNIYSSTYMASLPDIQRVFDPTKEELMGIFMRSLRSGDWQNACRSGNIDILEALMNGLKFPWAALLQMALRWPLLVFKGFMEQADINIAISKNIQKTIKMMNATIAAIQTQANAVHQAGAGMISSIEQLSNTTASAGSCGLGIHTPDPRKPPDALFDPIEDNLLYVPETWMIGLALLPSTIFAPYLWGPPISIPHGLAYWALDDSHVDWLNQFPDFPSNLWKRKDELKKELLTKQDCPPDFDISNIFNGNGNND